MPRQNVKKNANLLLVANLCNDQHSYRSTFTFTRKNKALGIQAKYGFNIRKKSREATP